MNGSHRSRLHPWMTVLVLFGACVGLPRGEAVDAVTATAIPVTGDPVAAPFLVAAPDTMSRFGLHIRLLDVPTAQTPAGAADVEPLRPLAADVASALLVRMAGEPVEAPPPLSFRFATGSMPAPRPGTVTRGSFPGAGAAAPLAPSIAAPGPLRAVFTAPHGAVTNTSQVSVTFSRPMVPLSAPPDPPADVRLTPSPAGAWRWLDTYTLVFEGTGELPGATRYAVEIPAGLAAADGTPLREPVRWTFSTSPPAVQDVAAMDGADAARPVIVIVFDQHVDERAVLPFLRLEVDGRVVPVRDADDADLGRPVPRWRAGDAPEQNVVVVKAEERIQAGTGPENWKATLRVLPGLPSLEGPLLTEAESVHEFEIRKGLRVLEHGCGRADACAPGLPWTIRFSNGLRPAPDTAGWARVEPALPGATIEVWQNHLVVLGSPVPGTTYRVWLDSTIATWRGQPLGTVAPLEFTIGDPPPAVWTPGGGLAVLPPEGRALYPILAEGTDSVRVRVFAVTLEDWSRYSSIALFEQTRRLGAIPGRELSRFSIPVRPAPGGPGVAIADLDAALDAAGGHVLLAVEPAGAARDESPRASTSPLALSWVQQGSEVVDVTEDAEALTVRVTSVVTGRPVRNVALALHTVGVRSPIEPIVQAVTDSDGLAVLRANALTRGSNWFLTATQRGRTLILPRFRPGRYACCDPNEWRPALRTHFVTDRPIYAPSDTVRFAGWLRRVSGVGREPAAPGAGWSAQYKAYGPRGETLADGDVAIAPSGRVEGRFALPAEVNAGLARVELNVSARTLATAAAEQHRAYIRFEVQEVRRPNFEVSLELDPGPHRPGTRVDVSAGTRYFTGGGLPGARVRWHVHSRMGHYTPPGGEDYVFGRARYWSGGAVEPATREAVTDAAGVHRLEIAIDSAHPAVPMLLVVQASVEDVDRQQRTAVSRVLVHPADIYVGLRTAARFVRTGEPLLVDAWAVDIDGRPVAGRPITLRALRQDRRIDEQSGLRVEGSVRATCALRSNTAPARCRFEDLPAGDYIVAAAVEDSLGRRSESEIALRVAGAVIPAGARALRDSLAVHTDRDSYEPGDTARILVETSLRKAEALLTVRRAGVLEARPVRIVEGAATVRLPITDAHTPNVELHVAATAADGATASGRAAVEVAPVLRTLAVTVVPRSTEIAPGDSTTVLVTVMDAEGRPVPGADVVLSGVDEALLALSRRQPADPVPDMYAQSGPAVLERSLRAHLAPIATPIAMTSADEPAGGPGTVTGLLIDGTTGLPIANAWIEIAALPGAWTGADGRYRLAGVPAGRHSIQALARGYVTGIVTDVVVREAGDAHANFVMLTREAVLAGGRRTDVGIPSALGARQAAFSLNALVVAGMPAGRALGGEFESLQLRRSSAGGRGGAGGGMSEVLLRSDFSPVAAFVTDARTGPDGRAEIAVTVPHSLTRYRLRAVAASGNRWFGAGEAGLTAKRILMVRPSPPRFLHQGDRFELPVIVENRASAPIEVDVAVRAANAALAGPAGQRVRVAGNDRVEVRFPFVTGRAGQARFQVAAAPAEGAVVAGAMSSHPAGDAAEVVLPVLLPAVTESFAVYGELDDARPVGYPLKLPAAALPGQGRVEVGFSTTAAHGLSDALWFLLECPFDLPEVSASRIIALSSLRNAPSASPVQEPGIEASIERDVTRLAKLQLRDGGWSPWTPRFDADPFISVHAAHALQRARDAGVKVPERTLADATAWLERIDEFAPPDTSAARRTPIAMRSAFPEDYPLQARRAVQAYALDVRRRLGQDVSASAARLLRDAGVEALPAEALGWLLPAIAARPEHANLAGDVRRVLASRLVRSAGTAAFVSPYDAGGRRVFYSPRRSDAVVLHALLDDEEMRALLAPIAHGLMAHRVRGRWSNTQENAFAVMALSQYLARAEATEPALVARAWTGPRLAGERAFNGRSDDRHELMIPTDSLGAPGADLNLVLARAGRGRLYYRVGVRYTAAGLAQPSARGFEVTRTYEAVDDPEDVRRDEDGTWRVRLGARVRVRITIGAAGPRYHVALTDPLPAGFEAINPFLAGTEGLRRAPAAAAAPASDLPDFYPEHVNVRADRFEAFTTLLQPGLREMTYYAIATTPGDFAAPSPRAEEMYAPETFGRGSGVRVVVGVLRDE